MRRPRLSRQLPWLALLLLTACGGCKRAPERIPIALMTKLQSGSVVGMSEVNAARLYQEDHPDSRFDLVPFDDNWKPDQAVEALGQVDKRGIRLLITSHTSTCAVAIRDEVNRKRILTFVTGATSNELSGRDDFILRNVPDLAEEQRRIAEHVNGLAGRRVLVLQDVENLAYTGPGLAAFSSHLRDRELVGPVTLRAGALDVDALARTIAGLQFDTAYVLVGGYNPSAGTLAQLVSARQPKTPTLFTPWVRSNQLVERAGGAIAHCILPSHYPPRATSPALDAYLTRFRQQFGYTPTAVSLNVYAMLEILGQAVARGHSSPEAIRTLLLSGESFPTRFGPVRFTPTGDVEAPLYFIEDIQREFAEP